MRSLSDVGIKELDSLKNRAARDFALSRIDKRFLNLIVRDIEKLKFKIMEYENAQKETGQFSES